MVKPNRWVWAVCVMVALAVPALRASDMVGVYALIDRVVLEPTDTGAVRVQLWGAFALADRKDGSNYQEPAKGYLYYSCPAGKEQTCRNEWADLKALAGTKVAAGFGGRYVATGRVRPATEAVASPDVYPIEMGVAKMAKFQIDAGLQKKLQDVLSAR
jgi:hypothetical protein